MTTYAAGLLGVVLLAAQVRTDDWPQFRGPQILGISTEKDLPLNWSGAKVIFWKTELPDAGTFSPITVGDKSFLTCYSGYAVKPNDPDWRIAAQATLFPTMLLGDDFVPVVRRQT